MQKKVDDRSCWVGKDNDGKAYLPDYYKSRIYIELSDNESEKCFTTKHRSRSKRVNKPSSCKM